MIARYFFCLLVWQVLAVGMLVAQPNGKIDHYSTEDGLSHGIINCIFKDSEGFMWFGTWNGINRFDGQRFVSYKSAPGDLSNLKSHRIDQITEDDFLQLWIKAYDGQVYRFNKRTEKLLPISSILKLPPRSKYAFRRILSTSNGRIWIETLNEGLLLVTAPQADSSGYYTYQEGMSPAFSLPGNHIHFLKELKNGMIWIGTQKGLVCLKRDEKGVYKNVTSKTFPANVAFTTIATLGKQEQPYFGTSDGQVFTVNPDATITRYQVSKSAIHTILFNQTNTKLYVTTLGGELLAMDLAGQSPAAAVSRLINNPQIPLSSMYEDKSGHLWVEPQKEGVIRINPVTGKMKAYTQKNNATYNYSGDHFTVFEDNENRVWVNLKGGGFGYYDSVTDKVEYFYNEPNSPDKQFSNIVNSLYYEPSGILWLRTIERGIEKITFQRNPFEQRLLMSTAAFISDNEVRGLWEDRKKRLWIGAKGGNLYVRENGRDLNNLFVNMPPQGLGLVYSIMQDRRGAVWLGTKKHGLYKAVPLNKEETKYKLYHFIHDPNDPASLSNNEIYALLEDKAGRVWVGSFENGLSQAISEGDRVTFVHDKNALRDYPAAIFRKIRHMAVDKDDNLWLGTTDGLLIINTSDPQRFTYAMYQKVPGDAHSLGNNDIQYIYRDSRNTMWLATAGGGLSMALGNKPLQRLQFKVYTTEDGLPNDYLVSCLEDVDHHLWIATQTGLSRFDMQRKIFRNYNSYDGVPNYAFSEASGFRRQDGRLVFGTIKGYLTFDPAAIADHPIHAEIALTNLQINNTNIIPGGKDNILINSVNHTKELTLKYDQNIISIDYVVLDFRSSDKQSYAYRLRGFDTGWHYNRSERRATYTNLPPGDYVFEVKCTNQQLYSNVPVKSMHITILPPWWKTWWAYLIYVLITAIIIEIVRGATLTMLRLRHRIAVEKKLAELKLNFFTNVSHELRTPLTLILNPIEEIGRQENLNAQSRQYVEVVRKNANRMARFVNQLLDLRKLQSGKAIIHPSGVEVVSFVKSIGEYFLELAREKKIDFQIVSDTPVIDAWLDLDKVETVIYNLVANAFKFTPEGKAIRIHITLLSQQNRIQIAVKDQGKGVPPHLLNKIFELFYEEQVTDGKPVKGTGIGLALSKEMITLHGGQIAASNNEDGGLTVTVTLPIGKAPVQKTTEAFLAQAATSDMLAGYQAPAVNGEATAASGTNQPLLLVVEDNTDLQAFLKAQLSTGYRVEVAGNGEEGLAKALELQPDLILSDIMMPRMDGIQLLDKVKNTLATSHIPVILLTAKSAIESQIEGLTYGADYYITKPFRHDFLVAAIRNLINQRKKVLSSLLEGKKTVQLEPGEVTITSRDEIFLQQIVAIVEEKMADVDFNIDTVAETIAMGRTTFYRKFKGLTGLAPVEFVREMRLKRAKQYLDSGYGNISEVAYSVGFNNAKYFSTCFKAKFEVTPSEYIKQLKEKQ
ncbi:hybrid sensor histidine kinase/response regulator transcription factor [Longitalea luteola]|uniref:hybrid sensor histidine kinase/response regulator transcription factor n=1 Tax=Longitalea luteola TaxID=2812563 RepID=UPI001A965C0C|nr:two-component regulator propeller domain-containing protein [Longitalea luteola]